MDKNLFKNFTYGLYIVSSKYNDKMVGCVVNAVMQITSNDPIFAVSLNKDNYTNKILKSSKKIAISILDNTTTLENIQNFGFHSSKDINKFANCNYLIDDDLPIINEGSLGYMIGNVIEIIATETHDIFLIKILKTKMLNNNKPLTYEYYQKNMKGISPKKAPTYIENQGEENGSAKYRCLVCGYIYDDAKEKVKFADLPDDWVCPMCGVPKSKFEKIN